MKYREIELKDEEMLLIKVGDSVFSMTKENEHYIRLQKKSTNHDNMVVAL